MTEYAKNDDMLIYDLVLERNLLQNLYEKFYDKLMPKYWFYGHFHSSWTERVNGCIHKLLDINEIWGNIGA